MFEKLDDVERRYESVSHLLGQPDVIANQDELQRLAKEYSELGKVVELYRRLLFNYLIGNEDMHLKNWSLITTHGKTELAPAYDCSSTTVALRALGRPANEIEETALPLSGKKKGLSRELWIDYLARERLQLNDKVINGILNDFSVAIPEWDHLINRSFLIRELQGLYREVVQSRLKSLDI